MRFPQSGSAVGVGLVMPRVVSGTPQPSKSPVLRVTTVSPWMLAVAAIKLSTVLRGVEALRRPHSSATRTSIGTIRSANRV